MGLSSIHHMLVVLFLLWKVQLVNSKNQFLRKPSNNCPPNADFDVLIIGGGAAGVAAARRLKEFNDAITSTNPGTPKLTFKLFEADDKLGGRAVAAYFMSGPPSNSSSPDSPYNPYTEVWVKDLYQDAVKEDLTDTKHYDVDGIEYNKNYVDKWNNFVSSNYTCVKEEYYAYAKGASTKDDKSIREALEGCGWPAPDPGTLQETLEWVRYDFPLLENVNQVGLYNLEFEAPVENVGSDVYYFKTKDLNDPKRAAASVTEYLAGNLINDGTIETGVSVTKIDISCQIAKVSVTGGTRTGPIYARRVLDTRSIGLRISYPLVTPDTDPLRMQLNALIALYGMGEYKTINLQFKTSFFNISEYSLPLYFTVDNNVGRGRAIFYMNLDHPDYYPGTNSMKTFFVTEVYEDLSTTDLQSEVNTLLEETLGKVFKPTNFNNCKRVDPRPFPKPNPDTNLNDCEWIAFLEKNPLWGGSYSFWKNTGLRSKVADTKFEEAWAPLYSDPPKQAFNYWPSGAAKCDCHSEFVQGAHWSGILTMNEILEDDNLVLYPGSSSGLTKDTFEYQACYLSCISPKKF